MTIDWTKPVETTEDPPRPVMILYALGNDTPYGFVVYNETGKYTDEFWTMTDDNRRGIRNVPKPKPAPVLREAWVCLYHSGSIHTHREGHMDDCDAAAEKHGRVECRRITWMSDGSPVPGGSPDSHRQGMDDGLAEVEEVRDERDKLQTANVRLLGEVSALTAETERLRNSEIASSNTIANLMNDLEDLDTTIDAMEPIMNLVLDWDRVAAPWTCSPLRTLVKTYRDTQAKPAPRADATSLTEEPTKSCSSCRNYHTPMGCTHPQRTYWPRCGAKYAEWEPK